VAGVANVFANRTTENHSVGLTAAAFGGDSLNLDNRQPSRRKKPRISKTSIQIERAAEQKNSTPQYAHLSAPSWTSSRSILINSAAVPGSERLLRNNQGTGLLRKYAQVSSTFTDNLQQASSLDDAAFRVLRQHGGGTAAGPGIFSLATVNR